MFIHKYLMECLMLPLSYLYKKPVEFIISCLIEGNKTH